MTRTERAADLTARIDRLPACRSTWMPVLLVSLAAMFEMYDLYQTSYVPLGLIRDGIFSAGEGGFFGLTDQATFASATFMGLFFGAIVFAQVADRFGRRQIFVWALLAYSAATAVLAFQTTRIGVDLCRFAAGIGLGVELVTIDAYIVEILPKHMRGRAFAFNHAIQFSAVPILAFLAWLLIPIAPFGISGWRYVVLIGSAGALVVWWIRRGLSESPRWLAQQGRIEEAEQIVASMESKVLALTGSLPTVAPVRAEEDRGRGSFADVWRRPYAGRTVMLSIFNAAQAIGFWGFTNWLPTLIASQNQSFMKGLAYSFAIAFAYPLMSLVWSATLADRYERKSLIVASAIGVGVLGPLFALTTTPVLLILIGIGITGFAVLLSMSYHAYQSELYPTRIRARAVGFAYSFSRLSTALTSYAVAFFLLHFGSTGVFGFISVAMLVTIVTVGFFGPRTRGLALEEVNSE
jgi:MFS transporter, putative metabolite:H+ symporter